MLKVRLKTVLIFLPVLLTVACASVPDLSSRLEKIKPLQINSKESASSASGLVVLGNAAYVVADDELSLYEFSLDQTPTKQYPLLPGVLPIDGKERSHAKPDFESLVKIDIDKSAYILAVPSGSKPERTQGSLFNINAKRADRVDFAPLYTRLKEIYPDLNVEGMVRMKEFFVLFHRGHGMESPSAMIYLHANKVIGDLKKRTLTADSLSHQDNVSLGVMQNTALHFSDADYVPALKEEDNGVLYVLASAEATDTPMANGKIEGTMFGIIKPGGQFEKLGWMPGEKFEGLSVQTGKNSSFYIVNDPDDRSIISRLLKFSL